MPPNSPAQFLVLLKRHSLMPDKHLDRLTRKLELFESTQDLANYLVENELLTAWQAKQLLSGNTAAQVGQYRIIDRLAKDEFGKRFVGMHKKLDRTVEVQVLSEKISDEVMEKSKSIIRQIASLDHPNLVRCLEIDRVKGRFVIIAEHLSGRTLADAKPNELSESDIAKMIRQCVAGLMFAHDRGVFHGELDRTKIVFSSGEFKIRDFAIANLKRFSSEDAKQPDSEKDLFELAEIGLGLLDEMPASASEPRERLSKIIFDLGMVEVDRITDLLDRWIAENGTDQPDRLAKSETVTRKPVVASKPAKSSEPQVESSAAKQESGANADPKSAQPSTPEPGKRHRKSPLFMFVGIAAAFALIFGGLFAYWISTRPHATQIAKTDAGDTVNHPVPTDEVTETKVDLETENLADLTTEDPDQTAAVDPDPKDVDDPGRKIVVDPVDSPQPTKPGSDPAPAVDRAEKTAEPPKPEKRAVKSGKDLPAFPKLPFREFAKHLELPALDNVEPIKIGKLVIKPMFLLGATLFFSPESTRRNGIFELRRTVDDKQRWLVSKRKSARSEQVDVATFWKADNGFYFQWLPAAQLDEDVNYLRNGSLKLETPDGQYGWLSLRSPVTIKGFQLAKDKKSTELKLEIPWLPSKGLVIEIGPFADRSIPAICAPEYVQPRAPALMYFTLDQSEAFLWLQVSASQRKAIVLEAELKVNELGAIKSLNPAALSQYKQANKMIAEKAAAAIKATKDKNAQQQYATVQKKATKTAGAFAKYETIVPKLYGKDIPVAIYLNVDKRHQLLIAKSPGFVNF